MDLRLRAVKGLAILLYIGPLFAGLGGLGPVVIAPFIAIFVAWLMVLRPEQFPSSAAEWMTAQGWVAVLGQVLAQTLLVSILLAVGRGLAAVADLSLQIGPSFPLAVSFIAIPLCRLMWDSEQAARSGIYLDRDAETAYVPLAVAEAASAVVPLVNLADDADDATTTQAVARVMSEDHVDLRLNALVAALARPDRSHAALRRAVIHWATAPELMVAGQVPSALAKAFEIARHDASALRLYLPRALALISAFPTYRDGFPTPAELRKAADTAAAANPRETLASDLREGLMDLAIAVEKANLA